MYSVSLKLSYISVLRSLYGSFFRDVKPWHKYHMPFFISSNKNWVFSVHLWQEVCLCSLVGYSKSWEVCSQLGQSEGYQDLGMRQELMAFALTHCPPCAIEALLAVSSSLQTQVPVSVASFIKVQCLPK